MPGISPLEDEILRVHREVEPLARLARDGVLVAQDQGARHDRVVEALVAHARSRPAGRAAA